MTGIRTDILEKDYYLTLLLYELSAKQDKIPAYFKGGTALYKAIKSIKRFSEDIDLTVETKDCSTSQGKKRLEESANAYKLLERIQKMLEEKEELVEIIEELNEILQELDEKLEQKTEQDFIM